MSDDEDQMTSGLKVWFPDASVEDREDRYIYGPRGEVVAVVKDRPFRGYRRGQ